jgi:glyoxylase-like metal-dependent hydrolase (beta-lactamase superfamily II)
MNGTVTVRPLRVGSCRHVARIASRAEPWKLTTFPAYCALIVHPTRGPMLFDTGYARRFFAATQRMPQRLYRALLPVRLPEEEELTVQLRARGVEPRDVGTVIVSHYHADHVAGLRDFPSARFIAPAGDTAAFLRGDNAWRNTARGFLPVLLPNDFTSRLVDAESFPAVALPAWMAPFAAGFDLAGDGSIVAVSLPGHSPGQIGLLVPSADGGPVFLVADACWSMSACRAGSLPSRAASFVHADARRYAETFFALRDLTAREPALKVLPAHCEDSWEAFSNGRR